MLKWPPILLLVIVSLVLSAGCVPANNSAPDTNYINTAVEGTMVAALVQTALANTQIASLQSATATPTFVPELPTLTPTPIFTFTPVVPQVSVSVPTNCRAGPGQSYDRIGSLLVGEEAEVVGRNSAGTYWYIRNPNDQSGYCWLWGGYATLAGNTVLLPIYAAPPSPTPSPAFLIFYNGLDTCTDWWVEIELDNTGELSFKSMSISVKDTVTNVVVSADSNGFTNLNGCASKKTRDILEPGDLRTISAPAFTYDPTGHKLRATVSLCTSTNQKGDCETQTIKFTP